MESQNIEKIQFITIGYIEWRKGQDILIDALEKIPKETLESCEFLIVGQDSSAMAQSLKHRIASKSWIRILGPVDRDKIHELLNNSDILICPSREDPMPTVCAEAMMHRIPCLVSDATGTADYISNGEDGLIFKSEDINDLKERIMWCISNCASLKDMGENAYNVYQNNYSKMVFEDKLLKYVNEMII